MIPSPHIFIHNLHGLPVQYGIHSLEVSDELDILMVHACLIDQMALHALKPVIVVPNDDL